MRRKIRSAFVHLSTKFGDQSPKHSGFETSNLREGFVRYPYESFHPEFRGIYVEHKVLYYRRI